MHTASAGREPGHVNNAITSTKASICLLCGAVLLIWLPRCKSGHINIYHTPPQGQQCLMLPASFLNHQAIVCHILFEKFPYFPVKFMKAAVCFFFSSSPL